MKVIKFLIIILIFCFFICIATFLQNYNLTPKIDYEIKLIELMNLLATVSIGLAIPFYVAKLIDDKKANKLMLIDECKTMLGDVASVKNFIVALPIGIVVNTAQQDEIMLKLEISEKQLDNLIYYLSQAQLPKNLFDEISFKQNFLDFWDAITGGSLMSNNFSMTQDLKSTTNLSFLDLEKELKSFIAKLQVY